MGYGQNGVNGEHVVHLVAVVSVRDQDHAQIVLELNVRGSLLKFSLATNWIVVSNVITDYVTQTYIF
jgi:hypothetical protein